MSWQVCGNRVDDELTGLCAGEATNTDRADALARFIGKPQIADRLRQSMAIRDDLDTGRIIHDYLRGPA